MIHTNIILKILKSSKSWDDVYNRIIFYNTREHHYLSGKLFEMFCESYYKVVRGDEFVNAWVVENIPEEKRKELELGYDYGIDLILETIDNKNIAVQCKFREDEDSRISWSKDKLANLFAEGNKCDHFIIFTNCAGVDKHSIEKYKNNLTVVSYSELLELTRKDIEYIIKYIEIGIVIKEKKIDKPYEPDQTTATSDVIKGFKNNDRGQLIMPCGTGKTKIALWIRKEMAPKRTLVLVPSLALVRQFKETWKSQLEKWVDYLIVCSEEDIDRNDGSVVSNIYELQSPGRVSTDVKTIRTFIKQDKELIVYSTYQSLPKISQALKRTSISFDLVICDEAHKTAGAKKSLFGQVLDDKNIQVKKRLFMTATPKVTYIDLREKLGEDIKYIADMSDEDTYGPVFHEMTFAEAIKAGRIVDYEIIGLGVRDAELIKFIKERKYVNEYETIEDIASVLALQKFLKEHDTCNHIISFHSNVKRAKKFCESSNLDTLKAFHINGTMPTKVRNSIMKEFIEAKKGLITNARCLSEGIDIPAVDGVMFVDPKKSKIDIVQSSSRALRLRKGKDGKKKSYIVIPIFHDNESNLEDEIEQGVYNDMVTVIRSMSDYDARIKEEITKAIYGKGKRVPTKNRILATDFSKVKLISLVGFEEKLIDSIFTQVIRKITIRWAPFEEARRFAISKKFKSHKEWQEYCKSGNKPNDIPTHAYNVYKNDGWTCWCNFLGYLHKKECKYKKIGYLPLQKALPIIWSKKFKNNREYTKWINEKDIDYLPPCPYIYYKKEKWKESGGWGYFLGNGQRRGGFLDYKFFYSQVREEARCGSISIDGSLCKAYKLYWRENRPKGWPGKPSREYEKTGEWEGWPELFGFSKNERLIQRAKKQSKSLKETYLKRARLI